MPHMRVLSFYTRIQNKSRKKRQQAQSQHCVKIYKKKKQKNQKSAVDWGVLNAKYAKLSIKLGQGFPKRSLLYILHTTTFGVD